MTNKLEKSFFDTFGIKPYYKYLLIDKTSRYNNEKLFDRANFIDFVKSGKDYLLLKVIKYYPQITDRILLELFVIMTRYTDIIKGFDSIQELKEFVLKDLIYSLTQSECNIVKQQVRTLFKEVNL